MKKLACSMVAALVLMGCAGRTAAPVAQYQYGDEKKPCEHLRAEVAEIQNDITKKTQRVREKDGGNAALATAGMLVFWPALFFMDLSEADKVELEALRKRHNALVRICADNNCGFELQELPPIQTETVTAEEKQSKERSEWGGAQH